MKWKSLAPRNRAHARFRGPALPGSLGTRAVFLPCTFLVLVLAVAASGPALAEKITIDYDPDYNVRGLKTFSFFFTPETSLAEESPGLHSSIVNRIAFYLDNAGLKQVDKDADVRVTYHASGNKELRIDTTTWGYGYPSGWYQDPYWGASVTTATITEYARGSLVVDVWDTASNKLVWRGTALNVVASTPKVEKKVDKTLYKMVSKWWKIRTKNEK